MNESSYLRQGETGWGTWGRGGSGSSQCIYCYMGLITVPYESNYLFKLKTNGEELKCRRKKY